MKLNLLSIAVVVLLAGCGKTTSITDVPESPTTPVLDTTAPPVPEGFSVGVSPATGNLALVWEPSTAPDVARYEVYMFSPDPSRSDSYVKVDETDASTTRSVLLDVATATTRHYRLRAVDEAGNRSAMTAELQVEVYPTRVSRGSDPEPNAPPLGRSEY